MTLKKKKDGTPYKERGSHKNPDTIQTPSGTPAKPEPASDWQSLTIKK
ncbi:hypothetical protein Uis4E_1446 [Bifidobacterium parmae]|uniref:YjzC family protein n=1 Tax=Bifidobacterium parmae TaxID=361854 RepID=A0A2N5J0D2_9BIFI|nr:hypothetical protein Uis4E_1446 [Bifidobacterium parmae]